MVVAALETVGGGERWGGAPFALLYDMNRLLGVPPPPPPVVCVTSWSPKAGGAGVKPSWGSGFTMAFHFTIAG